MIIIKHVKKSVISIIVFFLRRALLATYKFDKYVRQEVSCWNEGAVVVIEAFKNGPRINLVKEDNKLVHKKYVEEDKINVYIMFKAINSSFEVFTGTIGLDRAYCENRMIIKGNLFMTMSIVRIFNICEYYLFPKFIWRKILSEKPKTSSNSLLIYIGTILGIK